MTVKPISVYFITLNESATIAEAIQSVQAIADEIIVVDSGSTDNTVEIAESLGARVIKQSWLGFSAQKSFAMKQCRNDWVFNLDGDEIVPENVNKEIMQLVASDCCDAIRVNFEDIFMQQPMHKKSHKRSIVRVFNRHKVRYPQDRLVHENVIVEGKVAQINGCIIHHGYADVGNLMAKQNKYSSLSAKEKYKKGKKASLLKLFGVFPVMFLKEYLIRKMFLSGVRGFVHAMISAMYAFLKEAKLYQAEKTKRR
ncbi:glycosyltransferase family 2 protein [Gayadomonas joobiniege]|uniref:glycosyltransferase family 2 protein n=1 Tax=Gayadomonas joobiniege TaxID=1234606 RepID=UPI00037C0864|nr:glycosyltransferase family 2 protein [Gayadomonas joobiniege]